jgi:MFS family permease
MIRLLRAGAFRWMWAGESVSMLGDRVYGVALAWLTLTISGSPLTLGSVLIAGAVPGALLLLPAGAVTDRVSPRAVMLASNLARALLVALLAVLAIRGLVQLWHLYVISICFGVADAFFVPAVGSIVPSLVDEQQLAPANALIGLSEQVTMLAGPAAGGVLVAAAGPAGAFLVDGGSFVAGVAGLLPAPRAARRVRPDDGSFWSDVRAGLRHAWSDRQLRAVLGLAAASALTYSGVFAVGIPALARHRFSEGAVALGTMGAAWGLGQLLGALSAAVTGLPRRWGLLVIGMTVGAGLAFALLGLLPTLWAAAAVLAATGFGEAYSSDVALPSWIQRRSRADMLGRVNSLLGLVRQALAPVSFAAMGALAALDLTAAFLVAGAVMVVAAVLAASTRTVRELT